MREIQLPGNATLVKAIQAYGGIEVWKNHSYIEAEVSASGLAFNLKKRPFFKNAKIKMKIGTPYSMITPIGKDENISGILDGNTVRLVNINGDTLEERKNARSFFPGGRRFFRWDDLDMTYFANYAFWNYFNLPMLIADSRVVWTEKSPGRFEVIFPDSIPTHSRKQEFIFDVETGLLVQHNYTVDVFGKWARAANVVVAHKTENGITYTSSRMVSPRKRNGKPRKKPVLIRMEIHSFRLTN